MTSISVKAGTVYQRVIERFGVPVLCQTKVRSWDGWPDDARETLREWNRKRRLRFVDNGRVWGGYASGFESFTAKCSECERFFNSSGTTACQLDGRLVCDDCAIDLARAAA